MKWAELLQETIRSKIETVPPGWKTTSQIAMETGMSVTTTCCKLRELVKLKKIRTRKFKIETGGRIIPVPHFFQINDIR